MRPSDVAAAPEGVDESTRLDGIADEVYSQLVADEIALETKNAQLEQSQQFTFSLLAAMSDVLVAVNREDRIEETSARCACWCAPATRNCAARGWPTGWPRAIQPRACPSC